MKATSFVFIDHEPQSHFRKSWNKFWRTLHLDVPLLLGILALTVFGLFILYSAGNKNAQVIFHQLGSLGSAFVLMFILAQIPPHKYRTAAPWIFAITVFLLLVVLGVGVVGQGAQRWLNLGIFRFQPSELVKIALPMMLAWYFKDKNLPPRPKVLVVSLIILIVPVMITAKQPDLGTAIIIFVTGVFVLFLTGINWKWIVGTIAAIAITVPTLWFVLHDYQRDRILTFIKPESDQLGRGYQIIQSKIAIGSGGFWGKGWLLGSQTHLQFLPAHSTDFIFAVCGEELGFIGCVFLLLIFFYIVGRGLYISARAQDTFTRLLAGSLTLMFFLSAFVNISMVIGLLPVVGLPLPLISYGGSSMVTLMAGFGIIMSIHTHRKLLAS